MTLRKIIKYTLYILFVFLIILYFFLRFSFQSGFSIIVENKSDKTISSNFIFNKVDSPKIYFEAQQPNTTVKAWTNFSDTYGVGVGVEYKDKSGVSRIVPLAYVNNGKASNVALLIIKQIDENGVITEYESFNKSDDPLAIIWYELSHW